MKTFLIVLSVPETAKHNDSFALGGGVRALASVLSDRADKDLPPAGEYVLGPCGTAKIEEQK